MRIESGKNELRPWQRRLHEIIFEADTLGGKLFDILLLIAILLSITVVMLESIPEYGQRYPALFVLRKFAPH